MLGYEDAELETNSGWIEGAHPKLVQLDAGIGITEFGRKFSTLDASAKRNDGSDGAPRLSDTGYSNGRFVTASGVISSMKRADVTNVVSLT